MESIRLDIKGKRPHFFEDPGLDVILTALLETMSENAALRERVTALEHILQEKNILADGEVENVTLPDDVALKLGQEQQEFLTDAFRALNATFHSRTDQQRTIDQDTD